MSRAKPLTAEQCEAIEAILAGHSLSEIPRCVSVVAAIEYMLKDTLLLEKYLQRKASAITRQRDQISHAHYFWSFLPRFILLLVALTHRKSHLCLLAKVTFSMISVFCQTLFA